MTTLYTVDPERILLDNSVTLRSMERREFSTFAALAEALSDAREPVVVATYAGAGVAPPVVPETTAAKPFWLAALDTADSANAWLDQVATHTLIVPGGLAQLEHQAQRLLRLEEARTASSAQASYAIGLELREVVHGLRNPLNVVFGYAEILIGEPSLSAGARQDIVEILRGAESLLSRCEALRRRADTLMNAEAFEEILP